MRNDNLIVLMLGIIVVFFIGVVMHELRVVLLPFMIALLLSIIFKPIIVFFKRKKLPSAVGLIVVLLTFAAFTFLLGLALYSSIGPFVEALPRYQVRFEQLFSGFSHGIEALLVRINVPPEDLDWQSIVDLSSVSSAMTAGLGTFISFVSNTVLVLLFMLFILADTGGLSTKVTLAFPERYAHRIAGVIENIDLQVRQYLITKSLISLATGTLTWIVLFILGVDFSLIWGFIAFLLNFIPNIGSIIAVIFPFVWSLLQFDDPTHPLLVLALLGAVQVTMGNMIEPRIMAFRLNLSPLLVLVSLIFWGWLWGIWGMILAVPLTATIKIFFENIEPLSPLSVLMSGASKLLSNRSK